MCIEFSTPSFVIQHWIETTAKMINKAPASERPTDSWLGTPDSDVAHGVDVWLSVAIRSKAKIVNNISLIGVRGVEVPLEEFM